MMTRTTITMLISIFWFDSINCSPLVNASSMCSNLSSCFFSFDFDIVIFFTVKGFDKLRRTLTK